MISVILCIYAGDDPDDIARSFDSIINQTTLPAEVIIVIDGGIPRDLESEITSCIEKAPFEVRTEQLSENQGHGGALRAGVAVANGTYVAIQDADDISTQTRLERQFEYIESNDVELVGGQIAEFTADPNSPERIRRMPSDHEAIEEMFPRRCPINQTTVLARREAILEAGNYRNVDRMEDYDLWGRMLSNGCRFHNIDEVLSKVKVEDMAARRGGVEYAKEEIRQQYNFIEYGVVSVPRAILNVSIRVPFRFLPNNVRAMIYAKVLRNSAR